MLEITLTATSDGAHYFCAGLNQNELSNFELQMWIQKFGKRAVDWVQSLSLGWLSFMEGDVWIQNQPETLVERVNFFGEQKETIVGVVANEKANLIKVLDSIGIHTDGEWEIQSVTIPKTLNHPVGMKSRIPKGKFKKREGIWRAEFLRNMNTTSSTVDSVLDLMRGEELRGYAAYLVLRNTQTTQVKLFKLDIAMTSSKI